MKKTYENPLLKVLRFDMEENVTADGPPLSEVEVVEPW